MYPSGNYNYNDNEYYYEEEEEDTECSRCSIWACFGWNGEDQGKRFCSVCKDPPLLRLCVVPFCFVAVFFFFFFFLPIALVLVCVMLGDLPTRSNIH